MVRIKFLVGTLLMTACLLLAAATPAVADQCESCKVLTHTKDIGTCKLCQGMTTSGDFQLCMECSRKHGECERCLKPLTGQIDESKDGTYTSGPWEYRYAITQKDTRSEGRHGTLLYLGRDMPEPAAINDHYKTPWGLLYWVGQPVVAFGGHGWMTKPLPSKPVGGLLPEPKASRMTVFVKVLVGDRSPKDKQPEIEPWISDELRRLGVKEALVKRDWFPLGWESVLLHDTKMYGRAVVRLRRSAADKPLMVEVRNSDDPGKMTELARKDGTTQVIQHAVTSGMGELNLYLALRVGLDLGVDDKTAEIGPESDGKTVEVRGVDLVIVRLPGDIKTGLGWSVKSLEGAGVQPGGAVEYCPNAEPALLPMGGIFEVPLRVVGTGKSEVVLEYLRSWEKDKPAEKSFHVTLDVRDAAAGGK